MADVGNALGPKRVSTSALRRRRRWKGFGPVGPRVGTGDGPIVGAAEGTRVG